MDKLINALMIAVCMIAAVVFIGVVTAAAYTEAWQKDCDKLGATVVNNVAYRCERIDTPPAARRGEE